METQLRPDFQFPNIVGIDNGLKGGVVVMSSFNGNIITKFPMPTKVYKGKNEVDVAQILTIIYSRDLSPLRCLWIIEEPGGAKSYKAAVSMAASFHAIRGMMDTRMILNHRVTPQSWQKAMLGKIPKGETKAMAKAYAETRWPNENWILPRCRTPHDGMIDAAIIAEYGRTVLA